MRPLTVAKHARVEQGRESGARLGFRVSARTEIEGRKELRKVLSTWYAREKRDLPWRRTRDPYRIWISEAMLQQTRVETVIPYYRRFLDRFPSVRALASAPVEDVLAAWSGLGYYRRARSLRDAARTILERHAGRFPSRREELLELPGVGPYTAGAIASIAFDHPEPLVDGNVARVFSRLLGRDLSSTDPDVWSVARALVPRKGAGNWNQALMELGALVCTPREPSCPRCPVAGRCEALRTGRVEALPRKRSRPRALEVELVVLAVTDGERWLLEKREARGRMAGLWQMPTVEVPGPKRRGLLFPTRRPRPFRVGRTLCEVRHTITRHRIRATVKRATLESARPGPAFAWIPRERLEEMALTGMTRKCLSAILPARDLASRSRPSNPNRPRS
jgi:A/G-specific adenine glycosylase